MGYQFRLYFVSALVAGLIAPAIRAEDKTPVSYLLVGCIVVGVVAYKINDYFNPTQLRLAKLEEGLAAFKKETAQNFIKVVDGQALLANGQEKLVDGQQQLQQQVAATHKEVEGVRADTTQILEDTTSLKEGMDVLQQKIDAIDAQLKLHVQKIAKLTVESEQRHKQTRGQLDRIESSMLKKSDMPGISKDLELMIQQAVQKEFERARAERSDSRALPDASLSSERRVLTVPALQLLNKTT